MCNPPLIPCAPSRCKPHQHLSQTTHTHPSTATAGRRAAGKSAAGASDRHPRNPNTHITNTQRTELKTAVHLALDVNDRQMSTLCCAAGRCSRRVGARTVECHPPGKDRKRVARPYPLVHSLNGALSIKSACRHADMQQQRSVLVCMRACVQWTRTAAPQWLL